MSYSLSARDGKRREAALLLDGVELVAAAGEHLVRIGLVADVPDEAVARRVEDVVQRDGELDRAEARRRNGRRASRRCWIRYSRSSSQMSPSSVFRLRAQIGG